MNYLPGWESVDRVTAFSNAFTVLGLVALAFLVVFDVLAYAYGHRRDVLLQQQAAPRSITEAQRAAASSFLRGQEKGSLIIKSNMTVPDARHRWGAVVLPDANLHARSPRGTG
jgi:hypothetical protein